MNSVFSWGMKRSTAIECLLLIKQVLELSLLAFSITILLRNFF